MLIAKKAFRFAGRDLAAGEPFEASARDARVLRAIGKAEYAPTAEAAPDGGGEGAPADVAATAGVEAEEAPTADAAPADGAAGDPADVAAMAGVEAEEAQTDDAAALPVRRGRYARKDERAAD